MTAAPVAELAALESDLRALEAGAEILPVDSSLAVILASAMGVEIWPESNIAAEIHHLLDASLSRCCLNSEQGDDKLPEPVRQRIEAAWRTAMLVQLKVRAWAALDQARRAGSFPAPKAAADSFGSLPPSDARERNPEGGETERHLLRCLEIARFDAEEINRTFGAAAPQYAHLARLVHLVRTMLLEANDAQAEGPMVTTIAKAADIVQFELAQWRDEKAGAA